MVSMDAFVDELIKIGSLQMIGQVARKGGEFALKHKAPLAAATAGGVGVLGAQRGIEDIRMAEAMRARMAAQQRY